jgi:hypothetical protein
MLFGILATLRIFSFRFCALAVLIVIPSQIFAEPVKKATKIFRTDQPTFRDEFNGRMPDEPAECYAQAAICQKAYNGPAPCSAEAQQFAGLKDLNKCKWSIIDHPINAITAASWKNVEVSNGVLRLHQRQGKTASAENCGKIIDPTGNAYSQGLSDECPYTAAMLWSQPYEENKVSGMTMKYGRMEVRARMPNGKGSFPAHWLMPDNRIPSPWPSLGEIDVMEFWADQPDRVAGSLHIGEVVNDRHPFKTQFVKAKELPGNLPQNTFTLDFHTYAVEWEPYRIQFFVDGYLYASIPFYNQWNLQLPPGNPFYAILNSGVFMPKKAKDQPSHEGYFSLPHEIDFIRLYGACEKNIDFCPTGGTYIGTPGKETCLLKDGTEVAPACVDYRNLTPEYLNHEPGSGFTTELVKNYPNPAFRGETSIKFQFTLANTTTAEIQIFNLLGQHVTSLYPPAGKDALLEPGQYELAWDTYAQGGSQLAAGMYIARLVTDNDEGEKAFTKKNLKFELL